MISFLAVAKWRHLDLAYASQDELGISSHRSLAYANSGGPHLAGVLKTLSISPSDTALDIGCGKGGAILTLAKFPFARVDGLDLSERAVSIAKENLRKMGIENSTIYHCDATRFPDYDRYTHLYLYQPFPEPVMAETMQQVADSLLRRPRKLVIIYYFPEWHSTLVAAGFQKVSEFPVPLGPIAVYQPV